MTKREKMYSSSSKEGMESHEFKGRIAYKNYGRLLDIAAENGLVTFDINDAISFVIENFPVKEDKN